MIRSLGFLIALAGCAGGTLTLPTVEVTGTAADLALLEGTVSHQAGRDRPSDLQRLRFYALPDGSRIGCGTWDAPDPYGDAAGTAPFYVHYSGDTVIRVHLDDLTGYGPARTGCLSAEARLTPGPA